MKKILFATAISLIFSVLLFAQNLPTIPLHLDLPAAPMPYKIDGKIHLLYELHITSYRRTPVILDKLEVFGEKGESSSLASYDGSTLTGMIGAPGTVEKADAKKLIKPGERAIVFIDITLDRNLPTPNVLRHRLHISRPGSKDAARWIEHKGFKVNTNTPPIISPPLRGTGWIAFNGVSNFSDHRRATIVLSGSAFLAQRFAIDWAKVAEEDELKRISRLDT